MYSIKKRLFSIITVIAIITTIFNISPPVIAYTVTSGASVAEEFKNPGTQYRPKVRWWWPGGDVTSQELKRELNLLYEAGFGGAEIQPFDYGLNDEELKNPNSPIKDFMTDTFLGKVSGLLDEARKLGMIMDINMGSGYCAGESFVPLEDNEYTLMSADMTVNSDQQDANIPKLGPNYMYEQFTQGSSSGIKPGWKIMNYKPEEAKLLKLYAAKITAGDRNTDYTVLNDTVTLDLSSVELITDYDAEAGTFNWKRPDNSAQWQIIAVYSMPVGSAPIGSVQVGAEGETAYMVDALNKAAVQRYYKNWFQQLQSLMPYTKDGTLRAAFNDSFEFFAQRIYSSDLLSTFETVNKYSAEKYLPALLKPGRDQMASFFVPNRAEEFSLVTTSPAITVDEQITTPSVISVNGRINYDYDKAIAAGIINGWYEASKEEFDKIDLMFRQQGYNPPMDRIKAVSYEDIPEAENNNVLTNKVIVSGANFYDKPTITAETFVFYTGEGGGSNFMITPETYRQQADLMISSGVNEMIYHGFPYVYNDEKKSYGVQNWSPFCSPYNGYNIPTTFSESDTIWPYVKSLNQYVSRLQYLMKQGSPSTDVLVYLPLFGSENNYADVTGMLDKNGIAWNWINEELIESASYDGEDIVVNEKTYDAIILPNIDSIPVSTMEAIDKLSVAGAPVAIYGKKPSKQPSFNDGHYAKLDAQVADIASTVSTRTNSPLIISENELKAFTDSYTKPEISYLSNSNLNFIRRDYGNMGNLIFVRNKSSNKTSFDLTFNYDVKDAYVLDAKTGNIYETQVQNNKISGELEGNSSIVILGSPEEVFGYSQLSDHDPLAVKAITEKTTLDNWTLTVSGQDVKDYTASGSSALGLWQNITELKFCSDQGMYTTSFNLDSINPTQDYILQLGTLYGIPEISVNGSEYSSIPMAPYELNISKLLKVGENTVNVKLTTALVNRLSGYSTQQGEDGNGLNKENYRQFSGKSAKAGMVEAASLLQKTKEPSVNGISPETGLTTGGTTIQISGENLNNIDKVYFGTAEAASFKIDSDSTITAVSPQGNGSVEVIVHDGVTGLKSSGRNASFTYFSSSSSGGNSGSGGSSSNNTISNATNNNVLNPNAANVTPSQNTPPKTAQIKISLTNGTASNGGAVITLFVKPYIQNGRTMVGLRDIATLLNIESKNITWDAKKKLVLIKTDDKEIKLIIGQKYAMVNGQKIVIDMAPQVRDGRTVLPIAHIAKILGMQVQFNAATKDVTFVSNQ